MSAVRLASGVSNAVGDADSLTPMPPPRTSNLWLAYSAALEPNTRWSVEISGERDSRGADHESLALVALDPDVELHRSRGIVLLCDGAAETNGAVRQDESAERGAEAAEPARSRPAGDQGREQSHAHVAGRDHAGQPLAPRALVVREARVVVIDRAGVGTYLVLGEIV